MPKYKKKKTICSKWWYICGYQKSNVWECITLEQLWSCSGWSYFCISIHSLASWRNQRCCHVSVFHNNAGLKHFLYFLGGFAHFFVFFKPQMQSANWKPCCMTLMPCKFDANVDWLCQWFPDFILPLFCRWEKLRAPPHSDIRSQLLLSNSTALYLHILLNTKGNFWLNNA